MADQPLRPADYERLMERAEACRAHAKRLKEQAGKMYQRAEEYEFAARFTDRPCPDCGVNLINEDTSCFGVCSDCFGRQYDGSACATAEE